MTMGIPCKISPYIMMFFVCFSTALTCIANSFVRDEAATVKAVLGSTFGQCLIPVFVGMLLSHYGYISFPLVFIFMSILMIFFYIFAHFTLTVAVLTSSVGNIPGVEYPVFTTPARSPIIGANRALMMHQKRNYNAVSSSEHLWKSSSKTRSHIKV